MSEILQASNVEYTHSFRPGLFSATEKFHLGPVSFSLNKGETLAIIGNNGSGKSLIAKALVGAIKPSNGEIKLLGNMENHSNPTKRSKSIRMIFQHNYDVINPGVSIGSTLQNPLILNTSLDAEERRQKIDSTLRRVGLLPEHYHFYRHMLSDGQQQRIALARALILDPKIIVADEPFAALDPSVRSQTVNLILDLQKTLGLGFVFISHNIGIVRHISDRVLVIDEGKIVEQGDTQSVFSNPQHSVTQKLVQAHFNLVERHFDRL